MSVLRKFLKHNTRVIPRDCILLRRLNRMAERDDITIIAVPVQTEAEKIGNKRIDINLRH